MLRITTIKKGGTAHSTYWSLRLQQFILNTQKPYLTTLEGIENKIDNKWKTEIKIHSTITVRKSLSFVEIFCQSPHRHGLPLRWALPGATATSKTLLHHLCCFCFCCSPLSQHSILLKFTIFSSPSTKN